MTASSNDPTQAVLSTLLRDNNLTAESRLYREADPSMLEATDVPGVFRLKANPAPVESVIDVYGPGYVVQAEQIGPGLAFTDSQAPNWQETMELRALRSGKTDRTEVEVRLGDLLAQGGRMYPVESVTVERAWYFTMPAGSVLVRALP